MKSIIAALFTIYALTSGNRRLLQQTIPTEPANAGQGQPGGWVAPELPNGNAASYQTSMECVLPNTDPAGCAGRITAFQNANQNFKLTCSNVGACAAATLNFTYVNSMVERVEQISFSEQFAGFNAKVIMDSTQSARKQYIDKFECKAQGACQGCTVQLIGGAGLNDVDCSYPNFCPDCKIEVCEWDPIQPIYTQLLCGTPKPCFNY